MNDTTGGEQPLNALHIVEQALELPQQARRTFLSQHADDQTLDHLINMLNLAEQATDMLFTGPQQSIQAAMSDRSGQQVGAFQLEALIAEGGMGHVYRARRADGVLEQEVAIKIIRPLVTNQETIRRFELERQFLADLNHPNIAVLHDGGTTSDGLPYLVMEFIAGLTLDRYLAEQALSFDARLDLFAQIARGVDHAHKHRVIHRDLKPSNVLVNEEGLAKLLDFGISQSLTVVDDQSLKSKPMTPSYASPEQLDGRPLTIASDVYALGLLLFECLTGAPYREFSGMAVEEISQQLAMKTHQSASTLAVSNGKHLRGDLDAIIKRCLAQEPDDRYASVSELLQDLQRQRDGLPVEARGAGSGYRAGKFLRRHWIWVGAGAMATLSLGVGLFVALQQAGEAQRQRDIAVRESTTAEDSMTFLKNILFSANPWDGSEKDETVDDVLRRAETELQNEFQDDPDSRVYLLSAMTEIYVGRGNIEKALSYGRQSRALGAALLEAGEYEDSETAYLQALEVLPRDGSQNQMIRAVTHNELGAIYHRRGQFEEAVAVYQRAIALYETEVLNQPIALARTSSSIGLSYIQLRDFASAETYSQRAMVASSRATIMMQQRRFDEGVAILQNAVPLLHRSLGDSHPQTILMETSVGSGLYQTGEYDKGVEYMSSVLERVDRTFKPGHPLVAYSYTIGGALYCNSNETERGIEIVEKAIASRIASLGEGHWSIQTARSILGECYFLAGQLQTARPILEASHAALLDFFNAEDERVLKAAERIEMLPSHTP